MKKCSTYLIGISLVLAIPAYAQKPQTPPASNLGKQVNEPKVPPQVVYPARAEVVQDAVADIEDAQLTPEQYNKIKQIFLTRERLKATPYVTPPKPVTRTLAINLDPGISPPVIRLTRGQQTSIVFSDANGDPWFVDKVSLNRTLFSDGREKDAGSKDAAEKGTNVVTLEPTTPAAYGNVTVTLNGLSTPVILILTSAQDQVDMRVDAKIPGRNPDAIATVSSILTMPNIDAALTYFLDGVPPKEARVLKVTGMEGVSAWSYRDNLYVRAKAAVQYPAYMSAARSTTGMSVYRFSSQHSSVTFLTGGQAVTIFIQ